MRVAALSFDVSSDDFAANLQAVEQGVREASDRGCALVCLPEMWPTSFTPIADRRLELLEVTRDSVERLCALSDELGLVVAGTGYAAPIQEPVKLLNRLHVFDRGGLALFYDKLHLFTPTAEHENFVAGDAPPRAADTIAGRVAGSICYDLRFPEMFRAAFRGGAEILLCPAQWPSPRAAHWRALCIARAVESQCFLVAANRTGSTLLGRKQRELIFPGNSMIVSPDGEVLGEGTGEPGLIVADIDLEDVRRMRIRVPVSKDDRPEIYQSWNH